MLKNLIAIIIGLQNPAIISQFIVHLQTCTHLYAFIIIIFVLFSRDFCTFFVDLLLMQRENYNFPLWYFYMFSYSTSPYQLYANIYNHFCTNCKTFFCFLFFVFSIAFYMYLLIVSTIQQDFPLWYFPSHLYANNISRFVLKSRENVLRVLNWDYSIFYKLCFEILACLSQKKLVRINFDRCKA